MIDDLKLFRSMIKYHATIVGWLIGKKKVEKLDDRLVLYSKNDPLSKYKQSYDGEIFLINNDGSKRIPSYTYDKNFIEIPLLTGNFKDLVTEGFELFDMTATSTRYCLTSQFKKLLVCHYDILGDVYLPKDFPRLKNEEAQAYIKWMESKHEYLKNRDFRFNHVVFYGGYIGASGFSDCQEIVVKNIEKFGIFAYFPIYQEIEWTFDLVEKYKDQIIWERLMDDSNLVWEEDMLTKYEKYIPYKKYENGPNYTYSDSFSRKFTKYEHLGFLSNTFLRNHIDVLDWEEVMEKCKFSWNKEDLEFFCRYVLNHNEEYKGGGIRRFLKNKYFDWDAEKLCAYLQFLGTSWNCISEYKRLHKIFMQIPNIKMLAQSHIKDDRFWDIVTYDHDFDFDELSREFTVDNIKKNLKSWSAPIKNELDYMRRTPDTNYYYYNVITKWDEMSAHKNIPLTYELAKYLQSIKITIGGTFCESDGGTVEEDNRNIECNGLKLFTDHHFESLEDINKIINDAKLLKVFLSSYNYNEDFFSYITNFVFKKISLQEYIDIINQMKDWDATR